MTDVLKLRATAMEWREIDGEVVLLDGQASRYFAGNRAAAVLWPMLAEGATAERLATALTGRFDIEPERAVEDVAAFVEQLRTLGMLE